MAKIFIIILILLLVLILGYLWFMSWREVGERGQFLKIKVFFGNNKLYPQTEDCRQVYPLKRMIPNIEAVARATLEELLKGPTSDEKEQGYFTSINPGVKIQKLSIDGSTSLTINPEYNRRIENGVAKVDFDEQLEFRAGGSCRVAAIRAQIVQTLKQFPTVKDVVISINGRTEDILQP